MQERCWNCNSSNYINRGALEKCDDCGIACYYHSTGANENYVQAMEDKELQNKIKQQEEFEQYYEDQWGIPYNNY